ncbi:hypothetical protein GMA8713_05121 [Grimontia marina]|uniref:Uncharacterized protein n=1 Tax=Grimontia marina TaxID=646534 RepID=A0A128FJV8_9GAMM|nr:hypothetical protein GMA8713_05121 [Grimontia marina]
MKPLLCKLFTLTIFHVIESVTKRLNTREERQYALIPLFVYRNPKHVMMLNQAVPSLFKPPNIDVLTIQLDQIMGTTVEWQSR